MSVKIKITSPTLGYIRGRDDQPKLFLVPKNCIVTLPEVNRDSQADKVEVAFKGKLVTMFASDLHDRGQVLTAKPSVAG